MLLPEIKEREYRFKLALRMGLPIFGITLAFVSSTLITSYGSLQSSFYFESILIIAFSIYFIFFLIYKGFDTKITDSVTKVFTREYLYKYLEKEIKKNKEYSLLLVSVDNLHYINDNYGIKNGDKVLQKTIEFFVEYLRDKDISNFPIGYVKGGDFVIGLKGNKFKYKTVLELLCLKSDEFTVDSIEVKISGAINDTLFSNELEYLIEDLFVQRNETKNQKLLRENQNQINPNTLESYVINALKSKTFLVQAQSVFEDKESVIRECFIKLKTPENKLLYAKTYKKVLNKLGLMIDFDLMILEQNILECTKKKDEIFAINISPSSLRNYNFLVKVKELMYKNPDSKNKIMFILSEVEYYYNIDRYSKKLNSLREIGVKIAIDRLGSLHTSFLYLRDLDIDVVRFDSYYTKDIEKKDNMSIIDGYTKIAHAKGVKTWVKLIENEELKVEMDRLNVDYQQGKYLSVLETIYEK